MRLLKASRTRNDGHSDQLVSPVNCQTGIVCHHSPSSIVISQLPFFKPCVGHGFSPHAQPTRSDVNIDKQRNARNRSFTTFQVILRWRHRNGLEYKGRDLLKREFKLLTQCSFVDLCTTLKCIVLNCSMSRKQVSE